MMRHEDPAVTSWRIALAPQGRPKPTGRHWWRELVTDAFTCAREAWEQERELVALGYDTEEAEYAEQVPPPRLRDFMVHLSQGSLSPERVFP